RLGVDVPLGRERLRRLPEVEPFVLDAALGRIAGPPGAVEHLLEKLAGADVQREPPGVHELAQEEGHVAVPGDRAARGEVEAHLGVGIARVPPRVGRVVVADVAGVPAEDDVAEAEAGRRGREELLLMEVFAAQDAVDVGDGDLDLLVLRAGELAQDRIRFGHATVSPLVLSDTPATPRNHFYQGLAFDRTAAGGPWKRVRTKPNQARARTATAPPTM